jgi:WD40 repeat protein
MLWRDLPSQGEVAWPLIPVQVGDGQSIDCLAFSKDGEFLAAGGQDGRMKIWQMHPDAGVYRWTIPPRAIAEDFLCTELR